MASAATCAQRRALDIAVAVAARMSDPLAVRSDVMALKTSVAHTNRSSWGPLALADGMCGPLLLFAALERLEGGERYTRAIAAHVASVVEDVVDDWSLFTGWAGFAEVLRLTERDDRFRPLRAAIVPRIDAHLRDAAAMVRDTGVSGARVDLVSGIAGLALAASPHAAVAAHAPLLQQIRERAQDGSAELGLAHGLTGLLASLMLTGAEPSIITAALRAVIGPVSSWLDAESSREPLSDALASWCRGAFAAALVVRSAAAERGIDVSSLERGLDAASRRFAEWTYVDDGLCHGRSGAALLQLALRGNAEHVERITNEVMDAYDERKRFGFDFVADARGTRVGGHEFLNGASGCALALLTLTGLIDAAWLRLLGIGAP